MTFTEYNLSAVRLASVYPAGAPVGTGVDVTIYGESFADYGVECRLGTDVLPAVFLTSTAVRCRIPASAAASAGTLQLGLRFELRGVRLPDIYVCINT